MDLEDDVHLCIHCGRTIFGLDKYISHRKQPCFKLATPFLSDASENPSLAEHQQDDFASFPQDICKLSANDFFLSLNLQSISKPVANSHANGGLDIQVLSSSDPVIHFTDEKPFGSVGDDGNAPLKIDNEDLGAEKWETSMKTISNNCEFVKSFLLEEPVNVPSNLLNFETVAEPSEFSNDLSNYRTLKDIKKLDVPWGEKNNLSAKKKSQYSIKSRMKLRHKAQRTCVFPFCDSASSILSCPVCDIKFSFIFVFLSHILECVKQSNDAHESIIILSKFEMHYMYLASFLCSLCYFSCFDPQIFLDHLVSPSHCLKAAISKKPLTCFPCLDENLTSDDMKNHFFKNHFEFKIIHPVIIAQRKQKLHCCFCFAVMNSCMSNVFTYKNLSLKEQTFIKEVFHTVLDCSYGIDKHLQSAFLSKIQPKLLDPKDFFLKNGVNASLDEVQNKNGKHMSKRSYRLLSKKVKIKQKIAILPTALDGEEYTISSKHSFETKDYEINIFKNDPFTSTDQLSNCDSVANCKLCDKCGYTSKTLQQLTRHKRSHTGEKPFKCSDCNFTCSLSSQLLRHKRLHTGVKPYKCPYCAYACNTQENLRKHILKTKKHQGQMMYSCQYCDFKCNQFTIHRDHLVKLHSNQFPNGEKDVVSSSIAGLYEKL